MEQRFNRFVILRSRSPGFSFSTKAARLALVFMEKEPQDFSTENYSGREQNLVEVAGVNSEPSVKIEVLFFAKAREITGLADLSLLVPPSSSAGDYLRILLTKFPRLEEISNSMVFALNEEYALESTILKNGDELAIIPPISGG